MTERIDTRNLDIDDPDVLALFDELTENCDEDPRNGIQMIPVDGWVEYVKDLIEEICGDLTNFTIKSGLSRSGYQQEIDVSHEWPYRHVTIDYEAAAEELEQDWYEVEFRGEHYLCR